jgi:hypothetical protein
VREAVDDWLREGLDGTSDRTRTLYEDLLGPVIDAGREHGETVLAPSGVLCHWI